MSIQKRKTYDTRVKYLVRVGLLPDQYKKQINRSLIWKWKREAQDKYFGYELNTNVEELYELLKKLSVDDRMQKTLKSFYRVNKTMKDIIGNGKNYLKKIREHKHKIVDTINRVKETIGYKRGIKLFGIHPNTFKAWAMEKNFNCESSLIKLCSKAYPQQLSFSEVQKMNRILKNEMYFHWPIISIAYYAMKKSLLKVHPNTWYKYARLLGINRNRCKKIKRNYGKGLRASSPNEKWHADITQFQTADGKISYIYLVMDNFSRYITSWRVSDKICGKLRLATFAETIELSGIRPKSSLKKFENSISLIVDGGTENNNKQIENFLGRYPIKKQIALKDIQRSNSMVESVNKLLKYNYLFPKQIQTQKHLRNYIKSFVIPDYNNKRPHGSLNGLTPLEAYAGKRVDFKRTMLKMEEASHQRIQFNQTHTCLNCPTDCFE